MVFEMKSVNMILNNYSTSEKIQTCFVHVCVHTHTPPVYMCECMYVSVWAWMILWKLFSMSCILRGARMCYFLFKFDMIANKRFNKKVSSSITIDMNGLHI